MVLFSDEIGTELPGSDLGKAPDAGFDFKWVSYYPSMKAYGAVFDHYVAGGVQAAAAIVDPVMDCNISRIYSVSVMRESEDGG